MTYCLSEDVQVAARLIRRGRYRHGSRLKNPSDAVEKAVAGHRQCLPPKPNVTGHRWLIRMDGRARALLFVLCGSLFLEGVDLSMLGSRRPP